MAGIMTKTKIQALASTTVNGELKAFEYELGELAPLEVQIKVQH